MQGVDLILGTNEKYKVFDYLEEDQAQVKIDKTNEFWGASTTKADSHTRAFLKIQDGCNYVCSFCIIPFARGSALERFLLLRQKTSPRSLLLMVLKKLFLTGVNIGEYERTSGERLEILFQKWQEVDGLERLTSLFS
jgi:threonylcarbamoyladenosine tRNA methylthiotransferase MtaB